MVAVPAGLPGMKGLYLPVRMDSKASQEFMVLYHILKQQSPLKYISWRIMQYSGQIPTKLAGFSLLGDQGAESIHAKFNRLGLVIAPICERVENLLCIVNKHLLSIEPQLVAAIPLPAS